MGAKGGKEFVDGQSKGSNGQESGQNEEVTNGPRGLKRGEDNAFAN